MSFNYLPLLDADNRQFSADMEAGYRDMAFEASHPLLYVIKVWFCYTAWAWLMERTLCRWKGHDMQDSAAMLLQIAVLRI